MIKQLLQTYQLLYLFYGERLTKLLLLYETYSMHLSAASIHFYIRVHIENKTKIKSEKAQICGFKTKQHQA